MKRKSKPKPPITSKAPTVRIDGDVEFGENANLVMDGGVDFQLGGCMTFHNKVTEQTIVLAKSMNKTLKQVKAIRARHTKEQLESCIFNAITHAGAGSGILFIYSRRRKMAKAVVREVLRKFTIEMKASP